MLALRLSLALGLCCPGVGLSPAGVGGLSRPLELRGGGAGGAGWYGGGPRGSGAGGSIGGGRFHGGRPGGGGGRRWQMPVALHTLEGVTPRYREEAQDLLGAHHSLDKLMRQGDSAVLNTMHARHEYRQRDILHEQCPNARTGACRYDIPCPSIHPSIQPSSPMSSRTGAVRPVCDGRTRWK